MSAPFSPTGAALELRPPRSREIEARLVASVLATLLAQAILYRGAGIEVVWRQFVVLFGIGAALFGYALARFRATIGTMV